MAHPSETTQSNTASKRGLKLKTHVRAGDGAGSGGPNLNHNPRIVRAR